jgi:hypothetical protein
MAQGARQSSLFAAEDFSVVYESFSEANFKSYDFDTIRTAMVDYINNNYPENYNDWISSSEFVSLIELMAFLGHNLAFRADLATRENYLSTAERRESALRIAEFLSYTPTRNVVSSGYLKVDNVKTTEQVFDVEGVSLANQTIQFEDATDPSTYVNFITVMNSIFNDNSKFGSPFSRLTKNNTNFEVYKTNSTNTQSTQSFTGVVNGRTASFSLHSIAQNTTKQIIEEKTPDPYGTIDILYKNDNSGLSSPNTGFFVGFKQGLLEFKDFTIDQGLPNMVLDINVNNIANGQIWVQSVDEVGQVLKTWTSVDRLYGLNSIFNATANNIRDIYSVSSRQDDQVSIVFADGEFGNIPTGNIRVWYRTGLNQNYIINPAGFSSTRLQFDYVGADGNTYQATLGLSLKSTVSNASERESINSIKTNAGRFFATQDRMVTADDYSIYPVTVSENIRKIKSINRVHSGHSRFRDLYDPTATYSDAKQFITDGYLYEDNCTTRSIINLPTTLNSEAVLQNYIQPLLINSELKNLYYNKQFYGGAGTSYNSNNAFIDTTSGIVYYNTDLSDNNVFRWNQINKGSETSTGYITQNSGIVQRMGKTATNALNRAEINSLVEFVTDPYVDGYVSDIIVNNGGSGYTSAPAVTINGSGTGATATATVLNGAITHITITADGSGYDPSTSITLTGGGGSGAQVSVVVKNANSTWARVTGLYKDGLGQDDATGTPNGLNINGTGAVTLSAVIPSGARIKRIVPSWNHKFTDTIKTAIKSKIDSNNSFGLRYNASSQDWVVIDSANLPANSTANNAVSQWSRVYEGDNTLTGRDNSWLIRVNHTSDNWEILTRKTRFVFGSNNEIRFNNLNFEESFSSETGKPLNDSVTILKINPESDNTNVGFTKDFKYNIYGYYTYTDGYTDNRKIRITLDDPNNDGYPNDPEAFQKIVGSRTINLGTAKDDGGYDVVVLDNDNGTTQVSGRSNLNTMYNRIADINQVIDPAQTNIVDTFVLLSSYDSNYRSWAKNDGTIANKPTAPTVAELGTMFQSLEEKKSISDQIIYRPVRYKILFGDLASSELQAKFNVTKTINSSMSDNEIKQQVVSLIESYFNINNWDFGEEFYFTEMAAYIHNNLVGQISSITIQPVSSNYETTDLFEITGDSDELFLPVLTTSNIVVTQPQNVNQTTQQANTGVSI